jgi:hypothetical protein
MRRFLLDRRHDASGVSGLGIVAEGIQFSDGQCALRWLVAGPARTPATGLYASIEDLQQIHGHGDATKVLFVDPPHVSPLREATP